MRGSAPDPQASLRRVPAGLLPLAFLVYAGAAGSRPARAAQAPSGDTIVHEATQLPQPATAIAHIVVTLINRKGEERIRDVLSYRKDFGGVVKRLLLFRAPADIRGIAYLRVGRPDGSDTQQFVYQPDLGRFRRIAPMERRSSFMGSDFTYQDFETRREDEDTHRWVREDTDREHPCWVVESTPKNPDTAAYRRSLTWFREDNHVPVRIELYDRNDQLARIFTVEDLERTGPYWYAARSRMRDVQKDHQTILEVRDLKLDVNLDDAVFTESFLRRQ